MSEQRRFLIPTNEGDTRPTQMEIDAMKNTPDGGFVSAVKKTATVGTAAIGLFAATEGAPKANAADAGRIISTAGQTARDIGGVVADIKRENTRRQSEENRHEERKAEIETMDNEGRRRHTERMEEISGRNRNEMGRTNASIQSEVIREAGRQGWEEAEVGTDKHGTTRIKVGKTGQTPQERQQAQANQHEADMAREDRVAKNEEKLRTAGIPKK